MMKVLLGFLYESDLQLSQIQSFQLDDEPEYKWNADLVGQLRCNLTAEWISICV